MSRKERRKGISPVRLHSKAFEKEKLVESTLGDGSIQFEIEGFASTIDKDYDGDIILTDAFDLERFMKNPIMKAQHGRGLGTNIGKVQTIDIVDGEGVYIKSLIILNPTIESHKEIIHGLRHGLINGFSIGFGKIKMKWDADKGANIITSLELHEISLVDIPNNPSTVRKMIEIAKGLDTDGDGDLSLTFDNDETIEGTSTEDEDGQDENGDNDEETVDEIVSGDQDTINEPSDDAGNDDGDGLKSIIDSETVKGIILPAGELPTIGGMYRIKFTEEQSRWGDVYQWDKIFNCECVKISEETEEDGKVNHEIYWLVYTMEFDGWEPTTYVVKTDLDDTQIMELSDEQLKELGAVKNKEVAITSDTSDLGATGSEQEVITAETDPEEVGTTEDIAEVAEVQEGVEDLNNTDGQDNAEIGNEEGDQEETLETDPITDEGGDDLEIVSGNADDGGDESQKALKTDEVKALETKVEDLTKSLDEAKELIESQKALIESKDQIIAEKEAGEEEVAKTLEALADENSRLKALVERVNNNYKELGKLYDGTVDEVKQHPLASRVKYT